MANVYWFGGSGTWSDHANHWSNNSGNIPADPHGAAPGTDDVAIFDALSFTPGSATVTLGANANCDGMIWTNATNTPTLALGGYALFMHGDTYLLNGMTITATTGKLGVSNNMTLYTQGYSVQVLLKVYENTITLGDNFTSTAGITVIGGTFATGNFTVTCTSFDDGTISDAKTVTLGSSTVNCTAWDFAAGNLTLTANTSTIKVTGTGAFKGGSVTTYNEVQLNGTAHTVVGNNTLATLTLPAATTQTITFTDGSTTTITTPTLSGDATHQHTLQGSAAAGWNITKAGGGTATADYCTISNSKALPVNAFIPGTGTINGGGNTGWLGWDKKAGLLRLIAGGFIG